MRIIIAGAGEVGTHLAKLLAREEIDISLMDTDAERLGALDATYDILTKVGSPTSLRDLREIGVADADLFIAVTPTESENITACLIANQLGVKKTLARIDNYEYLIPDNKRVFEQMGLNHLIYPEVLASHEIAEALKTNWMRYHISLCDGALELCVVKVREGAEVLGKTFQSGFFNHGYYRVVAIKRGQDTIIPVGSDEILAGDMVYAVCTKENKRYLRHHLGKQKRPIQNIIVYGATRIAQKLVQGLSDDISIKIIDTDKERCCAISDKLSNALVLYADGINMDSLQEAGIQDCDAFVAVTGRSEENIFACLAAKRFGVKKTIAEIENIDYIPMAETLDIGTVLNKKTITAAYIYQMLLDATVLNVRNLTSADAEIVEFVAAQGHRITKHKIKDLGLPADVNIGAIVRAGEGVLVNGNTLILPDDHVVVFCKQHALRQMERFFK